MTLLGFASNREIVSPDETNETGILTKMSKVDGRANGESFVWINRVYADQVCWMNDPADHRGASNLVQRRELGECQTPATALLVSRRCALCPRRGNGDHASSPNPAL